jgi:hypothetical protein
MYERRKRHCFVGSIVRTKEIGIVLQLLWPPLGGEEKKKSSGPDADEQTTGREEKVEDKPTFSLFEPSTGVKGELLYDEILIFVLSTRSN